MVDILLVVEARALLLVDACIASASWLAGEAASNETRAVDERLFLRESLLFEPFRFLARVRTERLVLSVANGLASFLCSSTDGAAESSRCCAMMHDRRSCKRRRSSFA